jgi:type I restriction enzyme, S subunit
MKAGWEMKRLGEVCEFQRGLTYAKVDEVDVSDNIVLRATNINLATNLLDLSELKYINDNVVVPITKKVKKHSLMICTASGSKSHLGKVAYIDDDYDYAFGGFMGMITPKASLGSRFLFHLMTSGAYKDFIGELSDGANINNLKFDDLRNFIIPIPPFSEQQRIVAILDEAFEGIATAKANAEKNLKNARALFDSYLNSVFSQRGEGWVKSTFGNVCGFVRGPFGGSLKKSIFVEDGYAVYEQQHAIYDQFDDVRYFIDEEKFKEMKRFELRSNDLIMSCSGTMGRVAIVPEGIRQGIINQALLKLTPTAKVSGAFLKSWMESQVFQDALKEYAGGAAIQNVASVKILKEIKVFLPSIKEQERIIEELEALHEETQRLESIYQKKITALAALKKSILHQAFMGEL